MKTYNKITAAETDELLRLLRKCAVLRDDGILFGDDRESGGLSKTIDTLEMYARSSFGGIEGYQDEVIAERRKEEAADNP